MDNGDANSPLTFSWRMRKAISMARKSSGGEAWPAETWWSAQFLWLRNWNCRSHLCALNLLHASAYPTYRTAIDMSGMRPVGQQQPGGPVKHIWYLLHRRGSRQVV